VQECTGAAGPVGTRGASRSERATEEVRTVLGDLVPLAVVAGAVLLSYGVAWALDILAGRGTPGRYDPP
jgi:hypothetical protein